MLSLLKKKAGFKTTGFDVQEGKINIDYIGSKC